MTSLSLVPEIAKFKGISFKKLVEHLVIDASVNNEKSKINSSINFIFIFNDF